METTADIRAKMLEIWRLIDRNEISASQVRLHVSMARVILECLKVEMTAAHLSQAHIPPVPIKPTTFKLARDAVTKRQ